MRPVRLLLAGVALVLAIFGAPSAADAAIEGPTVQAYDAAGDRAAGKPAYGADLRSVRFDGTRYDGTDGQPRLRARTTGSQFGKVAVFIDTDRDADPDRLAIITDSASQPGAVQVQVGVPVRVSSGGATCAAAGFSGTPTSVASGKISHSAGAPDYRVDVELTEAMLGKDADADAGAGVAPRIAAVTLSGPTESGDVVDWLPASAEGSHSCGNPTFPIPLDMNGGIDRLQSGSPQRSRLIDRLGDGDGTDLLRAEVVQWTAAQYNGDPTVSSTPLGTTPVHPADLDLTFATNTGASGVNTTVVLFDGYDDGASATAPVGGVRIRGGGSGYVEAEFYVRGTGGFALTGCQSVLASTLGLRYLRTMKIATRLDDGRLRIVVPLDIAAGVFNGAGTDRTAWRIAIVGEKGAATPDYVPDTAQGAAGCGGGISLAPQDLPLIDAAHALPVATLQASPSSATRPATIALSTAGSTVAAGSSAARIRTAAPGSGSFVTGASRTLTEQRTLGTNVARAIVEDQWGGIDMAEASFTVVNATPVARVTPDPAEIVIPHGGSASLALSGATSSDPDASSGDGISAYAWELLRSGATQASASSSSYTPPAFDAGDRGSGWQVRLRVTDTDGATGAVFHDLTLLRGPHAKVTGVLPRNWSAGDPKTLYPGDLASFAAQDATTDGDTGPYTYDWDFDGNGTWDALNAGKVVLDRAVPTTPGTYTAKVRVKGTRSTEDIADGVDAFSYVVTPPGLTPPTAAISATLSGQPVPPASPRSADDTVTFSAAGSTLNDPNATPTRFRWSFGDGTDPVETTMPTTTHTYAGSGPVTASVTVIDDRTGQTNASTPATVTFAVRAGTADANRPSAKLARTEPATGSVFAGRPVTIAAMDVVNRGTGSLSWRWDLDGNGSFETDTGADPKVTTTYAAAGAQSVRARLTDGDGRTSDTDAITLDVRPAPTAPPTARLAAPATVKLAGETVDVALDATGSTGNNEDPAVSFAFDLDGDGSFETDTGDRPTATAKLTRRGAVTLGVQVTDRYGNRATATREVAVTSQADELAGCVGRAILRTVALGPIRATGCFASIDRGNAGPLLIASGEVDLSGIKISGATGSTVTPREFPDCGSKDCQDAQAAFNAKDSSASIALDLSAGHLWSARPVAMRLQGSDVSLPLSLGALDIELPFGKHADGFTVRLPSGAKLLGLPVQGEAEVRFPREGVTTADVNVQLPGIVGGFTSRVAVEARSGEGVRLNNLSIRIDTSFLAKALVLKRFWLDYSRADRLWEGQTIVSLPIGKGFDLTAAVRVKDGNLQSLFGEVGGLNRHLGKGVFLQDIRAGFSTTPPSLLGGIGVSVGPRLRVKIPTKDAKEIALVQLDGDLVLKFPAPGQAFVFALTGRANLLDTFPLADASLAISENGLVVVHGGIGGNYKIGFFRVTVDGWISEQAFNAEGNASVGLVVAGKEVELIGASAVASTVGVAACGRIPVINVGGGIGYRWDDGFSAFDGCDLGPYRAARPADLPSSLTDILRPAAPQRLRRGPLLVGGLRLQAAGRAHSVEVPRGTSQLSIQATGTGGAPTLTIATAGGRKVYDGTTDAALTKDHVVVTDGDAGRTSIILKRPPAGTLWVSGAGGPPIASLRTAKDAPTPRVRAKVTGSGARRTLTWQVKPKLAAGQRVQFAEVAGGSAGQPIVTTTKSSGRVRFAPAPGGGRRAIRATVLNADGLARRKSQQAGRFTVRIDRPATPKGLRLRRIGRSVKATWSGPARAGFELVATSTTGVQQQLPLTRRSFTLAGVPQTASVTVQVTALGAQRTRSRTSKVTLAAAQTDSGRALRSTDARPRKVRARTGAKGLKVSWAAGREAVRGWRVRFAPKTGKRIELLLPLTARSATFAGLSGRTPRGGTVTVTALRYGGRGPVSAAARVR